MLKIHEFRYITTDDRCNPLRQAWSRVYEYEWVLDKIKEIKPYSIHNTACGLGDLHIRFANTLVEMYKSQGLPRLVMNSDNRSRDTENQPEEFVNYDILKKYEAPFCCLEKFGAVLNISTLEHLDIDKMMLAFENLLEQVEEGGHLLLTFDRPNVPVEMFEKRLGVQCKKEGELLNGSNSVCPQDCRKDLNVIVLHIQK